MQRNQAFKAFLKSVEFTLKEEKNRNRNNAYVNIGSSETNEARLKVTHTVGLRQSIHDENGSEKNATEHRRTPLNL